MSYKYYFGPSGYGKSYALHKDILNISLEQPDRQIVVITPDQYTMQTQRDIVLSHPKKGMMNIEVVSFSRLASAIFEEVGLTRRIILDDTGKNLILRKISLGMKDELKYLGSNVDKIGYIHEIKSVVSEFMQYGISVKDVDTLIDKAKEKPALKGRLTDLQKLYAAFMKELENKYETKEEKLSLLASLVPKSSMLKDSLVVFDGFTGFTPVQGKVISAILENAWQVWFAFTVDRYSVQKGDNYNSLFSLTLKSVDYINKLAKEVNVSGTEDIYLDENEKNRLCNNKELLFLEKHLFRNDKSKYDIEPENISVNVFDEPRYELENVVKDIQMFIMEGNKYQDVAIVTGDIERYAPYAKEIFNEYGIPYFVDATRKLTLNPFTEYIMSGLDVVVSNFSYDSMIHFLRTGLTGLTNEEIDLMDNYLVARGIKGINRWKKPFAYPARYMKEWDKKTKKYISTDNTKEMLTKINEIREKIVNVLDAVMNLDIKKEYEAIYICNQLYRFIDDNNVYGALLEYGEIFEEDKDFSRKNEYDQVYRKVLEVLEQIAELIGTDKLTILEFIKILQAGIGEIKIGVLPPGMDYVPIGDIERARLSNIKKLYFIGVNDGIIPKNNTKGGLISDLDRDYLERNLEDLQLSPTPRQKMNFQKLYLYMNMTKPTEKLYVSYSKRAASGASVLPSYLIQELYKLFPKLKGNVVRQQNGFENVYSLKNCQDVLSLKLREGISSGVIKDSELEKISSLISIVKERNATSANAILSGAFEHYDNSETQTVSHELVSALYGAVIDYSISRLEKYANCAYSHFLKYGMNLKERETAGFESVDIGNEIHEILKEFQKELNKTNKEWKNVTEADVVAFVQKELKTRLDDKSEALAETAREAYQYKRIERILTRTILNMGYHLSKGKFRPKDVEVEFKGEISSPVVSKEDFVKVNGKIDRVDTYEADDKIYVKIIDYKTGDKELNLVKLYEGKQLQLLVYLDQAVKEEKKHTSKEVKPAAVFYYHVFDPMISIDKEVNETELNEQIVKELRDEGLFVKDLKVIELLDEEITDNSNKEKLVSDVADITVKKEDEITVTGGDGVEEDDLKTIIDYTNYKVASLAKEIETGNITVNSNDDKVCSYCEYKDICHQDELTSSVDKTEKIDSKNVMDKMKAVLQPINEGVLKDNSDSGSNDEGALEGNSDSGSKDEE